MYSRTPQPCRLLNDSNMVNYFDICGPVLQKHSVMEGTVTVDI